MKTGIKVSYIYVYLILAFVILIPFLFGKYLFLLDFVPKMNNYQVSNLFYGITAPVYAGSLPFNLISVLIPAEFFQKITFFLIFFLSGYSMHNLASKLTSSKAVGFYAGFLYMFNPYTYVRLLAGHWLILLAYAILPLVLKSFIDLLEKKERKETVKFVLLLTLVGFNAHMLVIAFIATGVVFLFWFWRNRDIHTIKSVILAGVFFALLNAYWLIPLVTAKDTLISSIGSEDLVAFAPRVESFSALFTLASMYGFWRAGYVYAKDFIPYWQVLFVFILFLSVYGFVLHHRNEKKGTYIRAFSVIGILGLILAAGINSPFSEIFRWLFDNTLLKGMRDSHKFVTLLILTYACLGALALSEFEKNIHSAGSFEKYKKFALYIIIATAMIIPFIYSFTFFNSFAGQIKTTDYPADWYGVNEFLNKDEQDFKVLFLPWHMYMDFHWVPNKDKRITNPAQHFFDKEIISGTNIEIGGIYRQIYSPEQLYIDSLLKNQQNITNLGELIVPLDIKYILLVKEADYKKYSFLFNQSDIELVKETENFYVFKNKHEVTKIYEVDNITYVSDWEEFLERSRSEDITRKIYLIGNSQKNTQENSDKKLLGYQKESPVRYELKENQSKKYLVFTEPYSESWELDGRKPMAAYGVANAYEANGTNIREIRYERFYKVYLVSYLISILTLIILILFYLDIHRKNPKLSGD